jgi:choline dehydrogenase-like flavoprotein
VRVADGSVFPTAPRATPALPTVALAERMAELLLAELSKTARPASTEDTGWIDAQGAEGRTARS